jgi:creatinine amidohydrolase/Fe(II)-dependent formamide hydrolase-like protein
VYGDPTLATKEKGKAFVEGLIDGICADLERFEQEKLPRC